jgi:hypothetical protein
MVERGSNTQILVSLIKARELAARNDEDLIVHLIDMAIVACRESIGGSGARRKPSGDVTSIKGSAIVHPIVKDR